MPAAGIVVMNDFVLPRRSTEGVNAFRSKGTFAHTVAHANKHLRLRLALRDHTFLFPLADVVAQVGRTQAFNWRTHYRGHVTWSDTLMAAVAERYVGFALAALGKATKCIVLDLDNTLWGGVLGEDGAAGIALGPQWPGSEFVDFQRELLDLQRQGILLAVCSKNNEEEALAVLRSHPSMLIREAQLAAYRINWEDKATNIRSLARELNIGLDHMLLIDDSPHERAWVRDQIPELRVPDLPADPSHVRHLGRLDSLAGSAPADRGGLAADSAVPGIPLPGSVPRHGGVHRGLPPRARVSRWTSRRGRRAASAGWCSCWPRPTSSI